MNFSMQHVPKKLLMPCVKVLRAIWILDFGFVILDLSDYRFLI